MLLFLIPNYFAHTQDDEMFDTYEEDLKFAEKALYASDNSDNDEEAGEVRYSDFFGEGPPGSEDEGDDDSDEDDNDDDEEGSDMSDDEDKIEGEYDDEDGSDGSDIESDTVEGPTSNYQKRKAALAKHIAELEDEQIAVKDWELRGEVKSADRPENSLLAVSADIER